MRRKLHNLWLYFRALPYWLRPRYPGTMTWTECMNSPRALLVAYTLELPLLDWPPELVKAINQWRFDSNQNLYHCMVVWFDSKVVR